jgi:Uma2 family endonuclease
MGSALEVPRLDPKAFLEWESTQAEKHEYLDGDIFAMVGVKQSHAIVAGNIYSALRSAFKGSGCRVFMSDMKVHIENANSYVYPDIFAACDARDRDSEYFISHPLIIVEVLSDTTAAYDRGEKFARYRMLDSLQEYLLVDPESRLIDLFRRDQSNNWVLINPASDGTIELASAGLRLTNEIIFEDLPDLRPEQGQISPSR